MSIDVNLIFIFSFYRMHRIKIALKFPQYPSSSSSSGNVVCWCEWLEFDEKIFLRKNSSDEINYESGRLRNNYNLDIKLNIDYMRMLGKNIS